MEIHVPYDKSILNINLPDSIGVEIIEPPTVTAAGEPLKEVQSALDNLLGKVDWDMFVGVKSVAIAINDKTRPVPHKYLLTPLLERLALLGIVDQAITLYVAVGTHPPMSAEEFPAILPIDILNHYNVLSHDSDNEKSLSYLGNTSQGTPVWSNLDYLNADIKIVVGNIEPHQFVGFSGGVKSAAIGLAGRETINSNHALMTHPASQMGEYTSNPARQDVEEIGKMIGINLALNAVLNMNKQIVRVFAGDPVSVMLEGVPLARQIYQVQVRQRYGLVIASPGGYPKDINVYQAQKGLANAARLTKPGGTVILIAACPEGAGSSHYENWMLGKSSYEEVIRQFQHEGFQIGPHKGYQIARDAAPIYLLTYSELDENLARMLLLNPIKDLQTAVDLKVADLLPGERIGVLPFAASTIPYLENNRVDTDFYKK